VNPAFSYDDIADSYAAGVDSAPYNALYERPAMLQLLPPLPGTRVLDAGCGPGWYAAALATQGASVTAIDASATMIRHARERFTSAPLNQERQP
jgi:2-polyprenyl-3-methyl-5-hydroxy-6-metoxy-1,4-benzoquinol methylase